MRVGTLVVVGRLVAVGVLVAGCDGVGLLTGPAVDKAAIVCVLVIVMVGSSGAIHDPPNSNNVVRAAPAAAMPRPANSQ